MGKGEKRKGEKKKICFEKLIVRVHDEKSIQINNFLLIFPSKYPPPTQPR